MIIDKETIMSTVDGPEQPMMFVDYKFNRTTDGRIQFDEELTLDKLTKGKWKEGSLLTVTIEDNRITLSPYYSFEL
jgi:hypothetical protein